MQSGVGQPPTAPGMLSIPGLAVPGIAVDSIGPSTVVGSPWLRAIIAFLLVFPVGVALLVRYRGLVDRSVEASSESPFVSVVYGVVAHLGILFAAGVFSTQLANAGLDRQVLTVGSTAVLGAVMLALAGLGFAVIGTWIVEFRGGGRRWHGLVAAAALGAAGWLLPVIAGLAFWTLLVSAGIGGPTRKWIHAERTVETELED